MFKSKIKSLSLIGLCLLGTLTSYGAERCENLFKTSTRFIDPGIGIVRNAENQPEVRLKLSHDDVFATTAFRKNAARLLNLMFRPFSYLLKVQTLDEVVQKLEFDTRPISYKHKLAEAFGLKLRFSRAQAESQIPRSGPMVMIAPHVRAGIDGITLASLTAVYRERDDVLILLTKRLAELQDIEQNAILIDDSGGPKAYAHNQIQQQRIIAHLKNGGAIVIFPSGENATKTSVADPYPYDSLWKKGLYRFTQAVPETRIIPVFVDGQLSDAFHQIKNISPALSGARLPVEMSQQIGDTVTLTIGQALIGADVLAIAETYARAPIENGPENGDPVANAFLGYLRAELYGLRNVSPLDFETHSPSLWIKKP